MFCKHCGAEIPDGSGFCGKCGKSQADASGAPNTPPYNGYPQQQQQPPMYNPNMYNNGGQPQQPAQGSGLAIAGMVCGILGVIGGFIPVVCYFTLPLALVGVILAAIALKKNAQGGNKGMAIAGLVCGIVGLAFSLGGVICYACICAASRNAANAITNGLYGLYSAY